MVTLKRYQNESETAIPLIQAFWLHHSHADQTPGEAAEDLRAWTAPKHAFYLILRDGQAVGFLHLGSRGGPVTGWKSCLFCPPSKTRASAPRPFDWQKKSSASTLTRSYRSSGPQRGRHRLYRRLGYDCLNSITIRKDLRDTGFHCVRQEQLYGLPFEIRRKD